MSVLAAALNLDAVIHPALCLKRSLELDCALVLFSTNFAYSELMDRP